MDYEVLDVEKYDSERGIIFNFLRREELDNQTFGQIYLIGIEPGKVRGNHYHKEKQEWIIMAEGEMEVGMKDVESGETETAILKADPLSPKKMRIGPGVIHTFSNKTEKKVAFIEYSTWLYDAENEDIYREETEKE